MECIDIRMWTVLFFTTLFASITFGQCCSMVQPSSKSFSDNNFLLRDGDVYVIYGDSITDNAVYPRTIENYVLTRFPDWKITFYNLGWGGDNAHNLFRVQRDVLPIKPTVFTECMGMNDGCYAPADSFRLETYVNAYRQMIPMLRKVNPDMRITLISPVAYENKISSAHADGCYPQTLRIFSKAKAEVAREIGTGFIDLNTAYAEKMGLGKVIYPDFILTGDGIHPNEVGQTIMAQLILKGMNAPSLLAFAAIDASGKTPKTADTTRCQIKDVKMNDKGELSFSRIAEALPCPMEATGEKARRFLEVVNFNNEINRDILMVKGLSAKAYELKINGVVIDTYSSLDLLHGVNISQAMKGPLWDQANDVRNATIERQKAHYDKWRFVWLKNGDSVQGQYDLTDKNQIEQLDKKIESAIQKQHQVNQPKWMTFTLTPVASKPIVFPEPVTYSSMGVSLKPPTLQPLDWTKAKVKTIDLRSVVNRAFADEVAGDGKGGWTDQGPINDLSPFPVGKQILAGVPFDVIDPAKNDNKSMVVISRREGLNTPAAVKIPIGFKAKILTFLHTSAWASDAAPSVQVKINFQGGLTSKTTFSFITQLSDWWSSPSAISAVTAWTAYNKSAPIYVLYTPIFNPTPEAIIESIEISAPEEAQWGYGLIAITALE